jgi:hypothetical protein
MSDTTPVTETPVEQPQVTEPSVPVTETNINPVSPESTPSASPASTPEAKPRVNEKVVDLGESGTVTVKRLKAGPYYEAQKAYAEWVTGLYSILESLKLPAFRLYAGGKISPKLKELLPELNKTVDKLINEIKNPQK